MEKMPPFTGGYCLFCATLGFFPAGRNTPVQTGADRRRQTARAQSAISAPRDRAVKMVLQLMPFPRIDGLYSGVWDGSSW